MLVSSPFTTPDETDWLIRSSFGFGLDRGFTNKSLNDEPPHIGQETD